MKKILLILGLSGCLAAAAVAIVVVNHSNKQTKANENIIDSSYAEETITAQETVYADNFVHTDEDEIETVLINPASGLLTDSEDDDAVSVLEDKVTEKVEGLDETEAESETTIESISSGESSSSNTGSSVGDRLPNTKEEPELETTNNENVLPIDIRETQE